jgi:hypothetical protein
MAKLGSGSNGTESSIQLVVGVLRIAEWPEFAAGDTVRKDEGVAAKHVDMVEPERRELNRTFGSVATGPPLTGLRRRRWTLRRRRIRVIAVAELDRKFPPHRGPHDANSQLRMIP